jgi:peptidoglycan-associated lipoprotein
MSKVLKSYVVTLLIIAALLMVACPKKPPVVVTPKTDTTPTVEMVPPKVDTTPVVKPPEDFVKTDTATREELPNNLDELNRLAQQKGYLQDAFFGYDESTLTPDAQSALTASASWLKAHPQYNLLIEGHCDERGTEQYNLALGDRRANTAKEYLATLGVDNSRMRTVSYGEERPFDPGHDESAWAKNRRDHLVLVGK